MPDPETDLRTLLRNLSPRLEPGCYIFRRAKDETDLIQSLPLAVGMFREPEGVSLIVPAASDAPQAQRLITLQVNSSLEAVGLTAAVAGALAAEGVPCNVVAAFRHDHLFVPVARGEQAVDVLRQLAKSVQRSETPAGDDP